MTVENAQTAVANLYQASRRALLSADDHELMERSRELLADYIASTEEAARQPALFKEDQL